MSNTLAKNLNLCFSMIKVPHYQLTNQPHEHEHEHDHDQDQDQDLDMVNNYMSSSSPPPPSFTKNYNSLYEDITFLTTPSSISDTVSDIDMMPEAPDTPDLTAAYASRRFFISSPGRSNSIVDSSPDEDEEEEMTDTPPAPAPALAAPAPVLVPARLAAGGVAVETYSPDPYVDFRQSMQEMVEAREVAAREDGAWEYLQELLLSYLALNPKGTHKYIVRAFADLVVSSMSPIIHHHNNNNNNKNTKLFFPNINNNNNNNNNIASSSFSSYSDNNNNNSAYVRIFN